MIKGTDSVDASSCAKLKPCERLRRADDPDLVRNPNYSSATDNKAARESLPDRVQVHRRRERRRHLQQDPGAASSIDDGKHPAAGASRGTSTDPSLRKYLHASSGDRTNYLTMNLTQPPFDDVHVRRAMNWVIDKAALVQAWGGPTVGGREPHRSRHDRSTTSWRSSRRTRRPATTAASRRRRPR